MPPIDPSPHAGEVMRQPSQPRYPEPKPDRQRDEPARGQPTERAGSGSAVPGQEKTDPVTGAGEDIAG